MRVECLAQMLSLMLIVGFSDIVHYNVVSDLEKIFEESNY